MGKSIRNTETVSNKEDVLSLLGSPQTDTGGPGKQPPKKTAPAKPQQTVDSKEGVLDLLSGTVKKKDGNGASSAIASPSPSSSPEQAAQAYQNKTLTPKDVDVLSNTDQGKKMGLQTLTPEAKDIFATAHNGPKKSDLVSSVDKLIDDYFPRSQDQKQNDARFQIKESVLKGSQSAILNLKKSVLGTLQQQITKREEELWRPVMYHPGAEQAQKNVIDSDPQIQQLKQQQAKAQQTIDEYGKMSLVSGEEMETWLKLDSEHPNIQTSVAAGKLGRLAEEKYGITSTSRNKEYDRMRTGFDLITRSLQMDINEALAYGIPSKNPELLKKAQDKIQTLARYRDMYERLDTEQFPDVGLDKTARFLGDIIAEKHPNKLIRTKEDVREAGKIANERDPGFMDRYGKFVDAAAEKQGQGTFIPRGGGKVNEFVSGFLTTSAKSAADLLKWRANVFGYEKDKAEIEGKEASPGMKGTTQSGTEPTKIVYDKEGKAYRELPNENYGTLPWNNFFRFAGESLPGLMEFIGAEGATKAVAQIATGAKMTKEASQLTGLVGATYLTSYNGNREFADANIDDNTSGGEAKKIIAANFLTLANAGIFHMLNASPSKMVEAAISKNVMPEVVEMFEKNNWEKLSQKTMEGFVKESVLPRAKAVVEKFAESAGAGFKMGTAAVADQKIKDMVGAMTNAKYTPSTIEDNARAFVSQALLMTGIGLPGMITTGILPHSTKEALHQAGLYAPQYIDMINDRVQAGDMDIHQGAGIISMIKTMGEELKKAALETNDDGTPLTTRQQRDIALTGFRARSAAAMEENGQTVKGGAANAAEKEAKDIRKENNWQSIEETPVFKSIRTAPSAWTEEQIAHNEKGAVDYPKEAEYFSASAARMKEIRNLEMKPVKSMADIDPAKQYTYLKEEDQEPVTTSGADLIHHLETGDIYEKEKPDDKVEKSDKTSDAEGKDKKPAEDKVQKTVGDPKSDAGKAAVKEANDRKKEVEDAGFDFLAQEDDGGPYKKDRKYEPDEVPVGSVGLRHEEHGKGLGTLGYILKGEEYLKQGRHLVSDAPHIPEARTDQATGVWKKLVRLGLATETSPGSYRYGGERENVPQEQEVPRGTSDNEGVTNGEATREANANAAAHLQASYDRLVANGADPNEPEMKTLKGRIDNLSSPKTETDGNVKEKQGSDGQEGSTQEDGQKGRQESDEKGNVNPDSGEGAEPPAKDSAPVSEDTSPVVGIRDSIVNADRIHRGLQPLVKEFVRSWGQNWTQLKDNMRRGFSPRKFIEETALKLAKNENSRRPEKNRMAFSDYDFATLLFDRLDIQNNILRATDMMNEVVGQEGYVAEGQRMAAQDMINTYNQQLEQNETVGRQMKSESGRALAAIQMMTKMNGNLLRWSEDMQHYYNGHVPEKIKEFVSRIEKEYKEKNEQLREHYEGLLKKAADDAFKKAQNSTRSPKTAKKTVKAAGKDLADKIRALRPKNDGNLQASLFGLPIAVYDTALVAIANAVEAGASLVEAIKGALKDVKFDKEEDRNAFMAHLQNTADPERPEAVQSKLMADIKSITKENDATGLTPEAVKPLRDLMTSYVKDGSVKSLDELVKKTHDALKQNMPDLEERDIRDAFSGHGMRPDTAGKIKSELTKMKEQAKAVSEYQDAIQRPPGETKAQEQKRLLKAAELYKKVEEYMREMGIHEEPPPTTTEGKKALALEKAKKRAQSVIEDLNRQILAGERKERNGVEPDHDLSVLRAEQKRLSEQLKLIDKAQVSPEEKIRQTEDLLNRQISNYERQIRDGIDPLKPKEERPTTSQIEELRKRKKELKKQVEGLRKDIDPNADPKQKALSAYNESLGRQIAKLEEKIKNGEYATEQAPGSDFSRDTVSLALEARLKKLQTDYYATKRAGEALNKSWMRKAMSLAAATKRAFVLSRISTFGRLGAAVGWNTIFEPTEAATGLLGYAATKIGFGKKINEQAERYGVPTLGAVKTMIQGEGAAFKALTNPQTWKDFVTDTKNGYSELSLMYGHGNEAVPKEARDTWMNIEHGLEAFGRAHGAVKGVAKRMEFTRSYVIRKEALRRKGQDVENPVVQQAIGAMAYQDALRSILMENNWVSEKYQGLIHELQKGGFGANALALTLQEMMPIVKIPTNLVLNAGRATLGTPLAGGVIAVRGLIDLISKGESKYGISKLTAAESDAILRNLRKGNVGMALMLGGFFSPNLFGASHYYQKGTDQTEGLEEGEVKFFGMKVPKWLADNPYLVTMKIGSSLRNSFDYYTDQEGVKAPQAAVRSFVQTAFAALKETPLLGTPSEAIKSIEGYGGDWFWYSQVKATLEPGILQEIAEDTDNRNGWYNVIMGDRIKRKPESVGEALKTGVPGLRQEVGEK